MRKRSKLPALQLPSEIAHILLPTSNETKNRKANRSILYKIRDLPVPRAKSRTPEKRDYTADEFVEATLIQEGMDPIYTDSQLMRQMQTDFIETVGARESG